MKTKIHWGYFIAVLYAGFVVIILTLVFKSSNQKFDLVTENYYEDEIKYQGIIDQKKSGQEFENQIQVLTDTNIISIDLPFLKNEHEVIGSIQFYRPSDEKKDCIEKLQIDSNGIHKTDVKKLAKGLYNIEISWTNNNKKYLVEKRITI